MSKAVQGGVEIAAGVALSAIAGPEFLAGAISMQAASTLTTLGVSIGSMGLATEAGAIAQAIGSNAGMGVTTRTPAGLRKIIRGIQRIGGTIVYCSTTGGSRNQYNLVIVLATHVCEAIENLYLDGRQVFWETAEGYNQTVNGINFGGGADHSDHIGPNGAHYNFGGKVFCAAFYGKQTADPTVVGGTWVGPTTITDSTASYPGFCSALQANDNTWSPDGHGNTPYLAGCTYVYLKLEFDPGTFPQFPEIRFTVHGKNDIYDPRTSTRGHTSNWALHVADALTDPTWGLGDATVNQAQLIAAANVCDELVTSAAGDEARYSLHMSYDTATSPGDAIEQMMPAAMGRLARSAGEWYIFPAYYPGVSFTLDESALVDAFQWSPRRQPGELVNRVTGKYIAPNFPYNVAGNLYDSNGYWNGMTANNFPFSFQLSDYPPYAADALHGYGEDVYLIADTPNLGAYNSANTYNAGDVVQYSDSLWQANESVPASAPPGTNDGSGNPYWSAAGNYLPHDLSLPCVLSVSQAQRLAKIFLLRNRQQGSGLMTMNLGGMALMPGDVIQFSSATLGWTDKLLEVAADDGWSMRLATREAQDKNGGSAIALVTEVRVQETDPSVYDWSDTEELTPYDVPAFSDAIEQFTVAAPTGLTAESDLSTALVQPNGTVMPRIKLSWTEPADSYVTNGGLILVQMCAHGTAAWQTQLTVDGQTTLVFLGNIVAGNSYDVRVLAQRSNGAQSAWTELDNVVAGMALSSVDTDVAVMGTLRAVALSGGTAQIIISSPFTATAGLATVSCTPSPSTLTGLAQGTLYWVYYVDANFAGGTVTPVATENQSDYLGKPGYYLIGSVTTPTYAVQYEPSGFSDTGSAATVNPTGPYTAGEAQVIGYAFSSGFEVYGTCAWSGFPKVSPGSGTTLHIKAGTFADASTATWSATIVADVGGTLTTLATITSNTNATDYTLSIASGTDLSTVSVSVTVQYTSLPSSGEPAANCQVSAIYVA